MERGHRSPHGVPRSMLSSWNNVGHPIRTEGRFSRKCWTCLLHARIRDRTWSCLCHPPKTPSPIPPPHQEKKGDTLLPRESEVLRRLKQLPSPEKSPHLPGNGETRTKITTTRKEAIPNEVKKKKG